jgi:glyoxylase-like metal-dependent hydrolase (beta-lactamase superfamily II)
LADSLSPKILLHQKKHMHIAAGLLIALLALQSAQKPEWCRDLPRPAYSKLERVSVADPWFEVYRIRPGVFAIYEPHQQEEVISYLIIGEKQALLFDTGMGISNIKKVVDGFTHLPVSVINSHTHNDHVSDNWRFSRIYGMDTAFTREHAQGTVAAAQEEIGPGAICGELPPGFDAKAYAVKPFHITDWIHSGEKIDLGGRALEVISVPGHTPDSIALWDARNGLLFTGDNVLSRSDFLVPPGNRPGCL